MEMNCFDMASHSISPFLGAGADRWQHSLPEEQTLVALLYAIMVKAERLIVRKAVNRNHL